MKARKLAAKRATDPKGRKRTRLVDAELERISGGKKKARKKTNNRKKD